MNNKLKFDIFKLKGKLSKMRDWLNDHHFPPRLMFILLGIISTLWFLFRVIPKPSRASYPCMRVAAPFMSGFVVYLITLGGITVALRKVKKNIYRARYIAAASFLVAAVVGMAFSLTHGIQDSFAATQTKFGPDDGPNQPIGTAVGINPGRVIWAWDPKATNENCNDYFFKPENTNQKVVSKLFNESVKKLAGKTSSSESWDAIFRYFNTKKHLENRGYTKGEKIFIKINQTSSRGRLKQADKDKGYYYPAPPVQKAGEAERSPNLGTVETSPFIVLEILRQLVNECGVPQEDISIGDPMNPTYGHNYDAWSKEFPNVHYADRETGNHGRTLIHPTAKTLMFYSDKTQTDKLYDVIENADYMINVANLKPHLRAGITLTAKNHFGSQSRTGAYHLHYSHVSPLTEGKATNAGYHKYRVMVDLMGSKYLGQNTLLFVIDGLYGGGASEGGPPVKYFMAPFNNDWSNSVFISQDQVALESVCYDFLRTEWNGTFSHDSRNNKIETMPNVNGVDDYLHQAADHVNWPKGISYDPDNSGKPIPSLGVHEHWNNPENKQYSRNLGKSNGIELISIPEKIVGPSASKIISKTSAKNKAGKASESSVNIAATTTEIKTTTAPVDKTESAVNKGGKFKSVVNRTFNKDFNAKKFYAAVVDDNNGKWFLTDIGIVSGGFYQVAKNKNIPAGGLHDFIYELSDDGPGLFIASSQGAAVASLPIDSSTAVTTFNTKNSAILGNNVFSVITGRNNLRWFGTDKGISALYNKKWLTPAYMRQYPEIMFKDFPITALATTLFGDTLYVATEGAGVSRVYRDNVDAITGASEYAQWGPIEMPSDKVYSLCVTRDGTQWLGTDLGAARHTGYNTLENWTVFNTENGLVDNFVQAIAEDAFGKLWFGTKAGVSVFDGTDWTSYTVNDGLISNNILFIMVDKNGIVYMGTDNGIMIYNDGQLICYRSVSE
jgi:hypothetical protein